MGHLYVLLGEVSIQVFSPIFNWIICLARVELDEFFIYFGDQILVRGIICKYIFLYGWFPFHFANVFFSRTEGFHFHEAPFLIFSFMSLPIGDIWVKILLCGKSEILLLMFSSRIFMVSGLIFKSFIHFDFIFVYSGSWWSNFIFLHVAVQISQHHLLKRLFLLHFMLLSPLSNINWPYDMGLFLVSLFCSIDLCVCSYTSTSLFWLQWP